MGTILSYVRVYALIKLPRNPFHSSSVRAAASRTTYITHFDFLTSSSSLADIVHENLKMGSDGESDQASGTSSDEVQSPTGVCLRARSHRRISMEVRQTACGHKLISSTNLPHAHLFTGGGRKLACVTLKASDWVMCHYWELYFWPWVGGGIPLVCFLSHPFLFSPTSF